MSRVPRIRFKGFEEDWEQRKHGEVFIYLRNNALSREELNDEDGFAQSIHYRDVLIKYGECLNVSNELLPYIDNKNIVNKFKKFYIQNGDVIIADTAEDETVGKCIEISGIVDHNIISGLHTIPLRPVNKFAYGYLGFYLNSNIYHNQLKPLMQGIKVTSISKNLLKTTTLNYPSNIQEQKIIGRYFDALNHLITLHQRKLEKLKTIKKSMLENFFPQNGEKTPKIRFSGFIEDWEQRKLGEIVKEVNRVDENSNAPVMMITANDGFIEQSERYSTDNAGKSLKKYILLKRWELAYNHGASKIRPFGSCFALTRAANIRIPFVYHCFLALEDNPEFLEHTLNGKNVENQLRKIVSSGARMDGLLNISFQEYTSIFIRCPIRKEQDKIAILIKSLDHLITLHQSKLEKLQKIKKSMLESMFV